LTITETAGGVSQSFTVTRAAVTLVRVGDSLSSITLGYGGRTVPQIAAEAEQLFGGSLGTVTLVNVAAGGTATADWASGGSEHAGMISAVTANPGCWVTVMLGSNDVAAGTSQGTYSTRMAGIIADCVAAGAAGAILHQVVYRGDHAPGSAGDLLVQGYNAAVAALVNGTTIRRGDVLGYDWFLANLATDMGSDFVHFSGVGAEHAADMQAWAEYSALNPAAGGGTGGVSLARFAGGPL
jgi:lysophospholipase L1-like esterase